MLIEIWEIFQKYAVRGFKPTSQERSFDQVKKNSKERLT